MTRGLIVVSLTDRVSQPSLSHRSKVAGIVARNGVKPYTTSTITYCGTELMLIPAAVPFCPVGCCPVKSGLSLEIFSTLTCMSRNQTKDRYCRR